MANQTSSRVIVAIKREVTFDTAPGATGASQLRIIDSPGLSLERTPIPSEELRVDANAAKIDLGTKSTPGSFNSELSVGGAIDLLMESAQRTTYTAAVAITQAEVTSAAITGTNSIDSGSGSWITEGVRVGDLLRLTGMTEAANNDIILRAVTVTAGSVVVAGTPLTNESADTSFTLTILKKAKTTVAGPTDHSYTIDQHNLITDTSQQFTGQRLVGVQLTMAPNARVQAQFTFMGVDRALLVTSAAPYFTTPSVTTGEGLSVANASIYYNGAFVTTFTAMSLNMQISNALQPVIGADKSPDVFTNMLQLSGSISGIHQDFSQMTLFDAGTEFAIGLTLEEAGTVPVGTHGIWLPRVKILTGSVPFGGGGDGAKIETFGLDPSTALATTSVDATNMIFQSTAA